MSQSKCRNKFSVMFWNVRHFGQGLPAIDADMEAEEKNQRREKHRERVKEVAAYIRNPKKIWVQRKF